MFCVVLFPDFHAAAATAKSAAVDRLPVGRYRQEDLGGRAPPGSFYSLASDFGQSISYSPKNPLPLEIHDFSQISKFIKNYSKFTFLQFSRLLKKYTKITEKIYKIYQNVPLRGTFAYVKGIFSVMFV